MNNNLQLDPVFLLGAGRSGTKFLRDILGESPEISIIPYDIGYVWRYGNESLPHDELTPDMLNYSTKCYVENTLPKLTKKNAKKSQASILIEKSVPNTLRPAFIHAIFPNARFIHLIRDGRAVSESAIRLWKSPPEKRYLINKIRYFPWINYKYAFQYLRNVILGSLSSSRGQITWGPRYKNIDQDIDNLPLEVVCARQWRKCLEISLLQLKKIKKGNVLEIRYEELMSDPKTIERICDFLELKDNQDVTKHYEQNVNQKHLNKWKTALDDKQLNLINNEIETLNRDLGYYYP